MLNQSIHTYYSLQRSHTKYLLLEYIMILHGHKQKANKNFTHKQSYFFKMIKNLPSDEKNTKDFYNLP